LEQAVIRERRQITLPAEICREIGVEVGDTVALEIKSGSLVITPSRKRALDALEEIRKAFQESGVTEKEFQAELRRVRRQLSRERYGHLLPKD
jgi:antitoxin component of MazEF toxin-antitoxin module